MIVHSFDGVLWAPRALHSIELFHGRRVPLWRPVSWVALVYFVVIELLVMALDNYVSIVGLLESAFAPVVGTKPHLAAWLICYGLAPAGVAWLASIVDVDGRKPHWLVVSYVRYLARPKRSLAGVPVRAEGKRLRYRGRVRVWWDVSAPRLHHGWVAGGLFSCREPVRFTHAARHQHGVVRPCAGGSLLCRHEVDGKVEVRP